MELAVLENRKVIVGELRGATGNTVSFRNSVEESELDKLRRENEELKMLNASLQAQLSKWTEGNKKSSDDVGERMKIDFENADVILLAKIIEMKPKEVIEDVKTTLSKIYKIKLMEFFEKISYETTDLNLLVEDMKNNFSAWQEVEQQIEGFYFRSNDTQDSSCAIYMYTSELSTKGFSVYNLLNEDLTSPDRSQDTISKWKYFLYHLVEGLRQIPKWVSNGYLYRGVAKDLVREYPNKYKVGNKITWYAFTSTSTSLKVAKTFFRSETATLCQISSSLSGRSITEFSYKKRENEVLFPPGSLFEIENIERSNEVVIITLKQIPSPNELKLE